VTIKGGGKPIATYHVVVKGEALNLAGKLSKADGTTSDFSAAYKRKSGGPGLAGTWISTEVKASISTLEVAAAGARRRIDHRRQRCDVQRAIRWQGNARPRPPQRIEDHDDLQESESQ
jgi:hypothetical protein